MVDQPNKPGGDFKSDDKTRDAEDEQAVKNQASVTPDDYPMGGDGKPQDFDHNTAE